MNVLFWLCFVFCSSVHLVKIQDVSFCNWLGENPKAIWRSASKFLATNLHMFLLNDDVFIFRMEMDSVDHSQATQIKSSDLDPGQLSRLRQAIDMPNLKGQCEMLLLFKGTVDPIRLVGNSTIFQFDILGEDTFNFTKQSRADFGLSFDKDNAGFVIHSDDIEADTLSTFVIYDLKFSIQDGIVRENFLDIRISNAPPFYYLELTNSSEYFLLRRHSNGANELQRMAFIDQRPIGFIFKNRVFLIDQSRSCVFFFQKPVFNHTVGYSYIVAFHSMPIESFFGCTKKSSNEKCKPMLPEYIVYDEPALLINVSESSLDYEIEDSFAVIGFKFILSIFLLIVVAIIVCAVYMCRTKPPLDEETRIFKGKNKRCLLCGSEVKLKRYKRFGKLKRPTTRKSSVGQESSRRAIESPESPTESLS